MDTLVGADLSTVILAVIVIVAVALIVVSLKPEREAVRMTRDLVRNQRKNGSKE